MDMTKAQAKGLVEDFRMRFELVRVGNGRKLHIVPKGTSATFCGSGHSISKGIGKMKLVRIEDVTPDSDFCAHCNSQYRIGRALYILAQPDEPDAKPIADAEPAKTEPTTVSRPDIYAKPTDSQMAEIATLDQAFRIVHGHLVATPETAEMRSSAKFCLQEAYSARKRKDYKATIAWLQRADSYLVGAFEAKRIGLMDDAKIEEEENSGMAELRTRLAKAEADASEAWLFYHAANDLLEEARKDLAAQTELRNDAEARAADNQRLFDDARHALENEKEQTRIAMNMLAEELKRITQERDDAIAALNELEDSI